MRTQLKSVLAGTLIFLFCTNCMSGTNEDRITPSKNNITEEISIEPFSEIINGVVADIYYTQSDVTSAKIYGPDNIVPFVKLETKGNTLHIGTKKKIKTKKGYKMKIYISSPELSKLESKGVGDVRLENKINTKELTIINSGVGDIKADDLTCESLKLTSKGVGDIKIKGSSKTGELHSSGVGDVLAENFEVEDLKVFSKGVGNVKCHATNTLELSSSGVGDIYYKGNPCMQSIKKGIGKIKPMK